MKTGAKLTVGQAAKFVGCSDTHIYNLLDAGKIKSIGRNKRGFRLFRKEDLVAAKKMIAANRAKLVGTTQVVDEAPAAEPERTERPTPRALTISQDLLDAITRLKTVMSASGIRIVRVEKDDMQVVV